MKKLVVVFVAGLVLLLSGLACGGSDNAASVSDAEPSEAQIKQQAMEDAAYYNSIIVVFNKAIDDGDKYAICNGTTRLVGLDAGETRRVELSSQEALNASLCKWNDEAGRWNNVQDIGGTSPGDYLEWSGDSFGITHYIP